MHLFYLIAVMNVTSGTAGILICFRNLKQTQSLTSTLCPKRGASHTYTINEAPQLLRLIIVPSPDWSILASHGPPVAPP